MEPKLRLAHELQFRLLPQSLPAEAPVSISAVLESYCHLSGDLFGWEVLRSGRFLIWIADMAGHGIRAGLASAVLHVLIADLRQRDRLGPMMSELNRMLHDCLRPGHDSLYATLFVMTLDQGGEAAYCSAGHPPVLVRRAGGSMEELESTECPVGLFPETEYSSRRFRLERGSRLLLYTDGVIESKGRHNELFGLQRLRRVFERVESGPRELTDTIYREIVGWQNIDKLDDDLTFLAVQL
ncbi:MAG: SpoIIE family protein phosphatase [Acidobacteria bacterium]|nr:SpoIIE family protein phosphatase [Acidobacteriota bacterium]NIM61772.1 SpoIIE family protein phosphatase [Acidobacteriota bacterium]NIO60016.1 SpoIIE family protein phosphatase [Acidobacteriota bacterium]NIQ29208.1 SpoIIE family protein phosphatase [Acidobacteriota bacterium]NIQ83782.1 SpoIIE family protein phosphatase [Acidobacteriota bacterium]